MMPRMLFHMPNGVFSGTMESMGIEEDNAADDECSSDTVGDEERFTEVDVSQKESKYGAEGEREVNNGEWKTLHSLIEAKDGEKA